MYTKEEHFLVKLLTNNAMQLEEQLANKQKEIAGLVEANSEMYRNYNVLKEKYDNAIAMLHGTELVKQEVIVQPKLFQTLDKREESDNLTPHFIMKPTRRKLTKEQAQYVWNMISMGNARIVDMARKFNCHEGTIHNVMSGVSYKEIDRSKQ
jgi:hypothetical protein